MKLYIPIWSVCILVIASVTPLFSQQTEHTTIPVKAPSVINFKEAAKYQVGSPGTELEFAL